jgi:hypothetical protein
VSSTDLIWRTRPTVADDPFPLHVAANRRLERDEFDRAVAWCRATFGPGLYGHDTQSDLAAARWLADIWSLHNSEVVTIFRFKSEANCAAFVLAWTGETP